MPTLFHLSPVENRDSIRRHGLDPRRMGAAPGLACSGRRELDGVYVCPTRADVDWFVESMGPSHAGGLDLWAIEVAPDEVLQTGTHGYEYLPTPVPPERITLAETFAPPYPDRFADLPDGLDGVNGATIEWGDELEDEFEEDEDEDDPSALIAQVGDAGWPPATGASPQPLPDWLAPLVAAALHDVTGATAEEGGLTLSCLADRYDDLHVSVRLHDANGGWVGELGFSVELTAALATVELATALQRWWIERPHVEGTLHPPCPDHRHAAIAAEHDDAAWWTCPADGRRLARIGTLR